MRLVLTAAVLGAAGCYHPNIPDHSLVCGPGGLCPSGFSCNAAQLCAKNGDVDDGGSTDSLYSGTLGAKDLGGMMGTLECSTKTGNIKLRVGSGVDEVDTDIVVAHAPGFFRLAQTSGPTLGVWSFETLSLPAGLTVTPSSDSDAMLVFASVGDMTIDGAIDWRGFGGAGGLSGQAGQDRNTGVLAGGGAGIAMGGGGGAGYGTDGSAAPGSGGGVAGVAYGTARLAILHAGAGGGGGGNDGGPGGNGGGSVALLSQSQVTIASTIDVSGSAGSNGGPSGGGGGGGGSGGSILVSAPQITLAVGHMLTSEGGAPGNGTGMAHAGGAGAVGRIWLAGVTSGIPSATPLAGSTSIPETSFPSGATGVP